MEFHVSNNLQEEIENKNWFFVCKAHENGIAAAQQTCYSTFFLLLLLLFNIYTTAAIKK